MIRKLKRRMILLVLSGLLLASAGLVLAINWMNWQSTTRQVEGVLAILAENDGKRPSFPWQDDFTPGDMQPPEGFDNMQPPEKPQGTMMPGGDRTRPEDTPEIPRIDGDRKNQRNRNNVLLNTSLSNYYTVQLDCDKQVTAWESEREGLYADEDVKALAQSVAERGDVSGRIDSQFYRLKEKDDGYLLIVVDGRMEIQNAQSVLRVTLLVALLEDALLSVLAVLLIRRLVKPVDEAMEKQKQFVWDASHELKTPLAVISANAEALAAEAGDSKPLQYIQSEVQRTDHLIQNLLTLARMEKGSGQSPHVKFDLSRALLEVALPFESAVFEAGKRMNMEIPDGVTMVGDEEMIKQLAVILLSNAEKYSDPGGSIDISLEAKGEKRVLQVHNTGPAIPQEAQAKIFDRFYRVDSSHNREIEGNGLGLAIAQSIVSAHKGKIAVHSEEGKGTTFTVTL